MPPCPQGVLLRDGVSVKRLGRAWDGDAPQCSVAVFPHVHSVLQS